MWDALVSVKAGHGTPIDQCWELKGGWNIWLRGRVMEPFLSPSRGHQYFLSFPQYPLFLFEVFGSSCPSWQIRFKFGVELFFLRYVPTCLSLVSLVSLSIQHVGELSVYCVD